MPIWFPELLKYKKQKYKTTSKIIKTQKSNW